MIIDSSALVAILLGEADRDMLLAALGNAARRAISAATYVEAAIVIDRRRDGAIADMFDQFIDDFEIELVPVSAQHARAARLAHRRFGRGSGHPARLNFGDCFAYALASERNQPLLFKGDDFAATDVRRV